MFNKKPCGREKPGSPFKYGKWKTYKKTLELVQVPRWKAIAESLNCQQIKLPRIAIGLQSCQANNCITHITLPETNIAPENRPPQ